MEELPPVSVKTFSDGLRLHPRVAYQGLFQSDAEREAILDRIPALVAFRKGYHAGMVIVDWDHRLPSHQLMVRIYAYYEAKSFSVGTESFDDRLEVIGEKDKFPEFDVPDFMDIPADEAYEMTIGVDGALGPCRLTSAWRRKVSNRDGKTCVEVARSSPEFAKLTQAAVSRPKFLGDLEAVSWTPPCESNHPRWTVDVWFLLAFDGRIGSGQSLLVDPMEKRVITMRDFTVRTG